MVHSYRLGMQNLGSSRYLRFIRPIVSEVWGANLSLVNICSFFILLITEKLLLLRVVTASAVWDGNSTNVCGPSKNHSNTLSVQNDQLFSEEYITFSLPINSMDIRSWSVVQNIKYCYITLNGLLSWKTFVRNECYF